MYKHLITTHIFSALLLIFAFPVIIFFLYLMHIGILPQDESGREVAKLIFIVGLWLLCWWYAFFVILSSVKIKATSNNNQKTALELRNELANVFQNVSVDENKIFETSMTDNSLEVTWNQKVSYNQILGFGEQGVSYRVSFVFDEKNHIIIVYTSSMHGKASTGIFVLVFGAQWKGGIQYENGGALIPSFELKEGKLCLDVKKLTYGNSVMIDPAIELAKSSGWNLEFVMLKHHISRTIYGIVGYCLFFLALIMLLVAVILRIK